MYQDIFPYLESLPAGDPFPSKLLRNPAPETPQKCFKNTSKCSKIAQILYPKFSKLPYKMFETAQNGSKLYFSPIYAADVGMERSP